MTRPGTILVVEDDEAIRAGLCEALARAGHLAREAADGRAALVALAHAPPDLVILDLMLPELDGHAVLARLRRTWPTLPVLILSARGSEAEKVAGLRAGADDYLAKPFGLDELLARVEALLRRARGLDRPVTFGAVSVDPAARRVLLDGTEVLLSPKELAILLHLCAHRGRVVSRDELLHAAWGHDPASDGRAVDFHVVNLRRKLGEDPRTPRHLLTRHGLGYELRA